MLLRLTPFPFALVSYLLGVTSVKLAEFILGSGIMAVHVAIWLYIGQTLNHFQEIQAKKDANESANFEFLMLAGEVFVAFIVGFFISYKAKIELDKQIEKDQGEEGLELRNFGAEIEEV